MCLFGHYVPDEDTDYTKSRFFDNLKFYELF